MNKQFPSQDLLESEPLDELDRWVDCWAGCIHVVVQNGLKASIFVVGPQQYTDLLQQEWAHYFQGGTESWTKILNPLGRYRVGLRFMAKVLDLDPRTYEVSSFLPPECEDFFEEFIGSLCSFYRILVGVNRSTGFHLGATLHKQVASN